MRHACFRVIITVIIPKEGKMPKDLEKRLKKEAKKKFGSTTSERARKYIYGTLRKVGWTPSHQKKRRK